jgi:hypothetical protein
MTNEKAEFETKGTPSELIFDNGKSYQAKDAFRGDSKGLVERNFQKTKKIIDDGYQGDTPEKNKR